MPNRFHRAEDSGVRNRNERICFIVNPRAAGGRAGQQVPRLRRAMDRAFAQWELKLTERPGHATELAAEAAGEFDLVAAVGGDGTCHEVVCGLMNGDRARSRKTAFTVIPLGTGSDLMKSLKVPRSLGNALWVAGSGVTLPTDVGAVTFTGDDGQTHDHHFINVAGFGANGEVVRRANRMSKRLGGGLTFLRASAETALSYEPTRVRLRWTGPEGDGRWEGEAMSVFVANGSFCGGGMNVGRGGTMQDGLLDVTVLPRTPLLRQITGIRRLYDGTLDRWPGAITFRASSLDAEPLEGAPPIDLDGEDVGVLPVSFRVLPGALNVRGGWIHNPHLGT